jgi:hypothetical protein
MNQKPISAADIFLAILALLLISVSFYQTWLGLEQIFGGASFIIALVLSLLLLFLIWMLRNAKVNGQPTGGIVGIYTFIALFCFIANFNALYTRFMRTDIYTEELRNINANYNTLEANVQSKLNYKYKGETAQNIETIKGQLMQQLQDPGNPGFGDRSKSLIRDLEKQLGKRIDILEIANNDYKDLAERMGAQIDDMVSGLSPEERGLKSDLNKAVVKWNGTVQEVLQMPKDEKDKVAQGIIDESLAQYNKLGNRAQTVLGPDKMKFEPIVSQTSEVGKIGYAFSHAVRNFGMYQFVVLAGCLLLDFVIVFIVLLVVKTDDSHNAGGRNLPGRRQGRVILPGR